MSDMHQSEMGMAEFGRYLARYDAGMSRQAVHKSHVIPKVKRGNRVLVPVAEALVALRDAGRITLDAAPVVDEVAPAPVDDEPRQGRPRAAGGGSYYDEKAKTEIVEREIKEIKLAELRGELVRTSDVTEALTDAGRRIGEDLEQLAGLAGEIAAIAREGGEPAVRELLRTRVRALRERMADALARAMGCESEDEDDDEA